MKIYIKEFYDENFSIAEEIIETNFQKTPEELLRDSFIALEKAKKDLKRVTI